MSHVLALAFDGLGGARFPVLGPVRSPDWDPSLPAGGGFGHGLPGCIWGAAAADFLGAMPAATWLVARVPSTAIVDCGCAHHVEMVRFSGAEVIFTGNAEAAVAYLEAHAPAGTPSPRACPILHATIPVLSDSPVDRRRAAAFLRGEPRRHHASITPDVARALLDGRLDPGESEADDPIFPAIVERIVRLMRAADLEQLWSERHVVISSTGQLLSGRHRMAAICELGEPFTLVVEQLQENPCR